MVRKKPDPRQTTLRPITPQEQHEAYLLYREGRISRRDWGVAMMHGLKSYDIQPQPKLPWWKRIFKGRSFA